MSGSYPTSLARRPWGVWFSSALSTHLPLHAHDCPELNLVMSGAVRYRVDGLDHDLEARAGQLVVLPAGVRHELLRASSDVTLWVVELNGVEPLPWLELPHALTPDPVWRKSFVAELRRLWLRPSPDETRALQERLETQLLAFRDGRQAASAIPMHPAVIRAKAICESQLQDELDVKRLARASGLSASRLAHLFADQVGLSPLQYRNFTQVQHFVHSYDGAERNLLGAALAAGFGSYAQFHRVFRQVCGVQPSAHFKWLSAGTVDPRRTIAAIARSQASIPRAALTL